jgi:hypothetical protein
MPNTVTESFVIFVNKTSALRLNMFFGPVFVSVICAWCADLLAI